MTKEISQQSVKGLLSELRAYHDREWMDGHEGLPAHKAKDYSEECSGCIAIAAAEAELIVPESQPATLTQAGFGENHSVGL